MSATTDEDVRRALRVVSENPDDELALRRLIGLRLREEAPPGARRLRLPKGEVDVVLEGVVKGTHSLSGKPWYDFHFVGLETGARYCAKHTDGRYAFQLSALIGVITDKPVMYADGPGRSVFVTSSRVQIPVGAFPWGDLRGMLLRATTGDSYPPLEGERHFLRTAWTRRLGP